MSTWNDRLKDFFGPKGYDSATMRRSLQMIVLFEAKRCSAKALATMKPFQRKAAYLDQCKALVESMDLLFPHQKPEILWRTATSKEEVSADSGVSHVCNILTNSHNHRWMLKSRGNEARG